MCSPSHTHEMAMKGLRSLKASFHKQWSWSQSCKWICKSAYDSVKIKHLSRKQSYKCDGIGVGRIKSFPCSSNSAYDSIAYNLVKTRLSESEAEVEE